jgi:hypothetical protein
VTEALAPAGPDSQPVHGSRWGRSCFVPLRFGGILRRPVSLLRRSVRLPGSETLSKQWWSRAGPSCCDADIFHRRHRAARLLQVHLCLT